jgi:hypothetical protein
VLGATCFFDFLVSPGDGGEGFKGIEESGITFYLKLFFFPLCVGVLPERLDYSGILWVDMLRFKVVVSFFVFFESGHCGDFAAAEAFDRGDRGCLAAESTGG